MIPITVESLKMACEDCKEEFPAGRMRPSFEDGIPLFRCVPCHDARLRGLEEQRRRWEVANAIQESEDKKLTQAQERFSRSVNRLAAKLSHADSEEVADRLVYLFGGNEGLAHVLFAQYAIAFAKNPGGKNALEAGRTILSLVKTATERRPPKADALDMTDEELEAEITQYSAPKPSLKLTNDDTASDE